MDSVIRYMLDSSFCIDVIRDKTPAVRERFKAEASALALSSVALHELFYGAANAQHRAHAREKVIDFARRVTVLDFDENAASHAGDIRAALRRQGQVIGSYDVLIAAHARSLGLVVVTGNMREFTRVEGLRCENWLTEEMQ